MLKPFIEISHYHSFVSSPIIIKYKYKLVNREAISFNSIMKLSSFICEENHVFIEEDNPSDKVVNILEEVDAFEVDWKLSGFT